MCIYFDFGKELTKIYHKAVTEEIRPRNLYLGTTNFNSHRKLSIQNCYRAYMSTMLDAQRRTKPIITHIRTLFAKLPGQLIAATETCATHFLMANAPS